MPFYALATQPLIESLFSDTPNVRQIWYADDTTAAGTLEDPKKWWNNLLNVGPAFGLQCQHHHRWSTCSWISDWQARIYRGVRFTES